MFKKRISQIVILCLIIWTSHQVLIEDTQISSTRNVYRQMICTNSKTYTSDERSSSQSIIKLNTFIAKQDVEKALFQSEYTKIINLTIYLIVPHGVGLFLLLVAWPCLCCCCIKPEKFPLCQKCRKPQKQMYSKCELKWTSYILIILCFAILGGSILALYAATDITKQYNNIGCKAISIIDDTIYGRISPSNSSRFFVGINNLANEFTAFKNQLSTFFSDSNSSLNTSSQVRIKQVTVQTQLSNQYSSYNNIAYSNAFSADGSTYVSVNSQFKDMLYGPLSNSTSILGSINATVSTIFKENNAALDPLIDSWSRISALTQSGLSTALVKMVNQTTSKVSQLNSIIQDKIKNYFLKFDLTNINIGMKLVYGLILALSILLTMSVILLSCCTVVRVRLLMYFTCTILVVLGLICFILLIISAALLPNTAQICGYIDQNIKTGNSTKNLLNKFGLSAPANLVQNCMSEGSGRIIGKLDPTFQTIFDDIVTISTQTLNFNTLIPSFSTSALNLPITNGLAKVQKVGRAKILQINDSVALTHINSVKNKVYPITGACDSANVNGDSWVPSFDSYSCPTGKNVNSECKPLSNLVNCPLGCYQIMEQFVSVSGDTTYATTLNSRYLTGCPYVDYLIKLHDNWNVPRKTEMDSVTTKLNTIQTLVTDYDNKMKLVQGSLNTFKTTLETSFNSRTNLTSGSFNGVDCRVIGESILQLRDSVCIGFLNSVHYNVIALCLMCYGILVGSFCVVCSGVRHFKHLQRMQVHVGYSGVPISVSQNRIFDK